MGGSEPVSACSCDASVGGWGMTSGGGEFVGACSCCASVRRRWRNRDWAVLVVWRPTAAGVDTASAGGRGECSLALRLRGRGGRYQRM